MKRNNLSKNQKSAKESRAISSASKNFQSSVNSQNDETKNIDEVIAVSKKTKNNNDKVIRVSKKALFSTFILLVGLIGLFLSLPLKQQITIEEDHDSKEAFLSIVTPVTLQIGNASYHLHKGIYSIEVESDSIVTEIEIDEDDIEIPNGLTIDAFKNFGGLSAIRELPDEEAPQGLCAKLIKDYKPKGSKELYHPGSYIEITDNSKDLLGLTEKPEDISLHFLGIRSMDRFGDSLYIIYNNNVKRPILYIEQKEIVALNKGNVAIYDISKANSDTITICEADKIERNIPLLEFDDALDYPIVVKEKPEERHLVMSRLCGFIISVLLILIGVAFLVIPRKKWKKKKLGDVETIIQDDANLPTDESNGGSINASASSKLFKTENEDTLSDDQNIATESRVLDDGIKIDDNTPEKENYKELYEEATRKIEKLILIKTKFEELQIEHQNLLRDFEGKLNLATQKVEEKASKTIETINNEAEKRIKKAEEEVDKTKSEANKVIEKANNRIRIAEERAESIRGELETKYAKEIDTLEKKKMAAEEKAVLADKKEKETAKNLIDTMKALEGSKLQINALAKSQEKFLKYLKPSSFASNLATQIFKLYQLSEDIEKKASEFLKIPLEDSYYVYKYLANYEASVSSINKPLFLVEIQMASKAQFVFNDSILGTYDLSKPENDLANDAKIYFYSKYLKDFVNAIVVLNESFAGLHYIVEDISLERTQPFVDFRKQIQEIVNSIGITVLSVKVFDRIGNNTDLEADTIDLGIGTTGTILEVKNCIVYLSGSDKPADKIHVIVQE